MRTPLRYTCMVCSGTLTSTTSGPLGESCGFHQYSPGLSGPVGLPVGVPRVCAEGFSTACAVVSRATERARMVRIFMSWVEWREAELQHKPAHGEIGPSSHAAPATPYLHPGG